MNALMDLTSRAVSFITLIQQIALRISVKKQPGTINQIVKIRFSLIINEVIEYLINADNTDNYEEFSKRAIELVWVSNTKANEEKATAYTLQIFDLLQYWFKSIEDNEAFTGIQSFKPYLTPNEWRRLIREVLYTDANERTKLASALQYLPLEIILALGAQEYTAPQHNILQMWQVEKKYKETLLSNEEEVFLEKFEVKCGKASALLNNSEALLKELLENKLPIAFEYIYTAELEEITANRKKRQEEKGEIYNTEKVTLPISANSDPYQKAAELNLCALAFSGGGIRSATFNLGILQGLAKKGILENFDYLSTVSGGGYIGSWLTTWIKRDGSVSKVSNRLNQDRSPDPAGEEVLPIKWLRMYSNYFSPNASIMSVDAWTIGMTWLRNTLLNQVIIFLLLIAVMFAGRGIFELWDNNIVWPFTNFHVDSYIQPYIILISIALLVPITWLAGLSMQGYNKNVSAALKANKQNTKKTPTTILWIAFTGAFLISGFLYSTNKWLNSGLSNNFFAFAKILMPTFIPIAILIFVALLIIAKLGRYNECFRSFEMHKFAWLILSFTAAISAVICVFGLGIAWFIFRKISLTQLPFFKPPKGIFDIPGPDALAFVLGVPLVLEVFSVTVVVRMALLGKYFPDERREWWGRIGAVVHRLIFLWILIMGAALFGNDYFTHTVIHLAPMWTALGGWVTLVGLAVKAGMSAKTTGKGKEKGIFSIFLNAFSLAGPYLFILGLLVFLPSLLTPLINIAAKGFQNPIPELVWVMSLVLALVLSGIAYLLARQVGVNEFSMHHFYRNRLVRAYLAATRRRMQREKTYNPFTGFDSLDDEKLSHFTNAKGYYGPYHILNTALNATQVTELDRQDRKAESFIFSPLYSGFDFSGPKASANSKVKSYDYAYRQTKDFAYKDGGPGIGTAMAISGAAVSPNHGYHSSPATAFLLTVFNVQIGWWIGNPRKKSWQYSDPKKGLTYIVENLIGQTNTQNDFLCLSDGGHFDNMGLYEMIRRQCSLIILCDAEQDNSFSCEGFANAIRRCRIDFGAEIDIDLKNILNRDNNNFSKAHFSIGNIKYAGVKKPGVLLYIKSSVTGDEPVDVREYSIKNKTFPHQSTADQFFDEEQFESYRKLGLHIAQKCFTDKRLIKLGMYSKPIITNSFIIS